MMKEPLPDKITIGPMRLEDVEAVHHIEELSFSQPWSRATFESEVRDNRFAHYLVARNHRGPLGYGGMWVILDEAHVTTLAVLPRYRRRGLGGRLLRFLMDLALHLGATRMTLEVRISNQEAMDLYKKFGFVQRGMRKQYYQDEDAYIMWKDDLTR
jgi:[ribosomal protein S18]-alanine N-acetyltransferase